uniref:Uncharacterized protein n=1 Tax=Megaselia scalaris TaxID=36166 RepID=T1H288_MEGSC
MIGDMNGGSPRSNGMFNGSTIIKDPSKTQPKELVTIRCQEKQKQKLADMIKCALSEVGCEELPSGCDDVEQTFIENNFSNDQQPSSNRSVSSVTSSRLPMKSVSEMMTLLRAPFKRKSVPSMMLSHRSPQAPRFRSRTRTKEVQKRSQSLGSLTVTPGLPPIDKLQQLKTDEVKVEPEITKSIDAQLDRIDEINRTLDRRLVKKKPETEEKKDKLNEIRRSTSSTSSLAKKKGVKRRSISFSQKSIHSIFNNIKGTFSKSSSMKEKSHEDSEINDILKGVSVIKIPQNGTTKPKKAKIFRSKLLSFQIKKNKICRDCSKRRKIHPVKSVFDFAKEFNIQGNEEEGFCSCDEASSNNNGASGEDECFETNSYVNEDGIYIKEHMYCEPFK